MNENDEKKGRCQAKNIQVELLTETIKHKMMETHPPAG
jgi:hypothetical protein